MNEPSSLRTDPERASRAARGQLLVVHACGLVAASTYAALALRSVEREHVPLAFLFGVQGIVWVATLLAFRAAGRSGHRRAILVSALAWAAVFRVAGLCADTVLEDDPYRFLWDGYVFAQTGTPYGTAPIEWFGDPGVPEAFEAVLDEINHPDLPTIYGPVCELAFLAAYAIAPASMAAL